MAALTTGRYFESPRWRDGFLWLVDSLARTISRIDSNGHCETLCEVPDVPAGLGFLPTGEAVVTAMFQRALLRYSGGRVTNYVDLSKVARGEIGLRRLERLEAQAFEGGLRVADGRLHFAFAIGIADPTGQRDDAVVGEDIAIERVQSGVVDVGGEDAFPEIVELMCPPALCGGRVASQRLNRVDLGIGA